MSFTVAQAVAAAEAIERGLRRREAEGLPIDRDGSGRHADDGPDRGLAAGRWSSATGIVVDPDALPWSGVAVFKRAYRHVPERGFRARLLGAAIRHHYHWSELIGGDVVITLPAVMAAALQRLDRRGPAADGRPGRSRDRRRAAAHFPDFVRAYEPDGLTVAEFDAFGATARTLRAFIGVVPRAAPPGHRRADPEPGRPR